MILKLFSGVVIFCFIAGCSTTQSPTALSRLRIKVVQLERHLDEKDREIQGLKVQIKTLQERLEVLNKEGATHGMERDQHFREAIVDTNPSSKEKKDSRVIRISQSPEQVQTALQNAGYYDGEIDGRIGSKSIVAIKEFQRDHDLVIDGIVGKKTWKELKNYLE